MVLFNSLSYDSLFFSCFAFLLSIHYMLENEMVCPHPSPLSLPFPLSISRSTRPDPSFLVSTVPTISPHTLSLLTLRNVQFTKLKWRATYPQTHTSPNQVQNDALKYVLLHRLLHHDKKTRTRETTQQAHLTATIANICKIKQELVPTNLQFRKKDAQMENRKELFALKHTHSIG